MATKPSRKMTISERAKQFMPFSALKGLDEALLRKEQQMLTSKIELCDDEIEAINKTLSTIAVGCRVCVTYYDHGKTSTVSGTLEFLSKDSLCMRVNGILILFKDIVNIKEIQDEKVF